MAQAPGREGAVAPAERVNIKYRDELGGQTEDVELPLRLLVIGDFRGRDDTTSAADFVPLEGRRPIAIDKQNFDEVLASQQVALTLAAPSGPDSGEAIGTAVELRFAALKDFEPEALVGQIPELRELLVLRKALAELKGPLAQNSDFRRQLQLLLDDEAERRDLLTELALQPASP